MTMRDLIVKKEKQLQSISPNSTIFEAVSLLVEHDIGALVVMNDHQKLVGIISERDILRLCYKFKGDINLRNELVMNIMTSKVFVAGIEDDINIVMNTMNAKRIRHVPIMEGNIVVGLISIRDLVRAKLETSHTEIQFLQEYITS